MLRRLRVFLVLLCLSCLFSAVLAGEDGPDPGDDPGTGGDSSGQCDFTPLEAAFMRILKADARQRRAGITCNPVLLRIARARARDMAERGYFSHTNPDGDGPNILLLRAGYALPSWWGNRRDANNIESISAGRATAAAAYQGWMNSPGHRRHVLGEIPFYAGQTVVAIGHYYAAGSTYRHYWVFLSAPPAAGK